MEEMLCKQEITSVYHFSCCFFLTANGIFLFIRCIGSLTQHNNKFDPSRMAAVGVMYACIWVCCCGVIDHRRHDG